MNILERLKRARKRLIAENTFKKEQKEKEHYWLELILDKINEDLEANNESSFSCHKVNYGLFNSRTSVYQTVIRKDVDQYIRITFCMEKLYDKMLEEGLDFEVTKRHNGYKIYVRGTKTMEKKSKALPS